MCCWTWTITIWLKEKFWVKEKWKTLDSSDMGQYHHIEEFGLYIGNEEALDDFQEMVLQVEGFGMMDW